MGNAFGFCPKIVKNDILLIFNLVVYIVLLLDSINMYMFLLPPPLSRSAPPPSHIPYWMDGAQLGWLAI